MDISAVIFDFDGVIGETMADNHRAWSRAFAEHGIEFPEEEYFLLEGMGSESVAETILERRGADITLRSTLVELKDRYYLEDNSFRFYPHIEAIIAYLGDILPLGLVSGAGHGRLTMSLPPDFLSRFRVVITRDTVMHTKPHPEPYMKAADTLGVDPSLCLAVENAPLGIRSAKSAGMICVAICTTLDESKLAEADVTVQDHTELFQFFKNLGQ
jgi:beta-phosphoglucomutase